MIGRRQAIVSCVAPCDDDDEGMRCSAYWRATPGPASLPKLDSFLSAVAPSRTLAARRRIAVEPSGRFILGVAAVSGVDGELEILPAPSVIFAEEARSAPGSRRWWEFRE
jgi:hypothetical protein